MGRTVASFLSHQRVGASLIQEKKEAVAVAIITIMAKADAAVAITIIMKAKDVAAKMASMKKKAAAKGKKIPAAARTNKKKRPLEGLFI